MLKVKMPGRWWRPVALAVTSVLGLVVRLYGLDWDGMLPRYGWLAHLYGASAAQGTNFHPDERQIMYQVIKLSWPTSQAQFFDQAHSPLNPHFFAYGSFPLYLLASIGNLLSRISPTLADFAHLTLTGRVLNVLFDVGTILLTAWLAFILTPDPTPDRRRAWSIALLSAAFVAFTPFEVQQTHFFTVDTIVLFFVMLTILASVKLIRTERPVLWAVIAALGYGLGLATKTSAAPLALPILIALGLRLYYKRDFWEFIIPLLYVGSATVLVFVVAMPYALLDWTEFSQQVSYQGDLARGLIDLPYVRQFAGTTPVVYQIQNLVLWGLGLTLGVTALAGLFWICWRLWNHRLASWLVPLSWLLVYAGINCTFFTKYMRYLLPIYPLLALLAATLLITLATTPLHWTSRAVLHNTGDETNSPTSSVPDSANAHHWRAWALKYGSYTLIGLVLAGTLFQCLALDGVYSQPNTRDQASAWIYSHLKPGTVLTYEQWDDALPVALPGHDPALYPQATYPTGQGQVGAGLPLYDDDTAAKAQTIAAMLMQTGAITMPTDRLDKSIPRLPARYPLTIHYYQLLFNGQLGFHLAAQFENRPSFLGITLNDSGADESYSVFDHPDARIFVRNTDFPFQSADQLVAKLLQGVQLPPPNPQQTSAQKSLLLTPQQLSDDQNSPPFEQQFPANSAANQFPILFWWLALALLGLLTFPLAFLTLRGLADRGYLFAKTLGLLLLAYGGWLLSNWRLAPFSQNSLWLICALLASVALALVVWLRRTLWAFLRERWRLLLLEECLFTLTFLLFVVIRSFNPDLWHISLGGEKPMELAFLNGIMRSSTMPPLDPWFSGGIINYYYYGYVIMAAPIKLTGIIPTTAFNLAIPTLFSLTFTGAFSIVYTFSRRISVALLGAYLTAMLGNLDAAVQTWQQLTAALSHLPIPAFSYWQSSRIIPFTINEFPFWSFLFADMHPHVIAMPLTVLLLGMVASLLSSPKMGDVTGLHLVSRPLYFLLAAFVFGTIACVNPWDMPVCAALLGAGMVIEAFYAHRSAAALQRWLAFGKTLCLYGLLCALTYIYYWPFYASYQQLYVNGLGIVKEATAVADELHVFGFWLFLVASFLLFEGYRLWGQLADARPRSFLAMLWRGAAWKRVSLYLFISAGALTSMMLLGTRVLLCGLLLFGLVLFLSHGVFSTSSRNEKQWSATLRYIYLLLLLGLGLGLGIELVYIRDFLDGGDYARMNTFFKFSMPLWLCLAIGGALAIQHLWRALRGFIKGLWSLIALVLFLGSSLFLLSGTLSRIGDHQGWVAYQRSAQNANYTPTLDGFAFARAWYPGDAAAITWLNTHISGAPTILEAATPYDFTWAGRVSTYTGLPDVVGWLGHEGEQRYQGQPTDRMTDVSLIYTTTDSALALELLHHYNVRYIYVGDLEHQAYAPSSSAGLDKFDHMVGEGSLGLVYRADGVSIYEVL